MGLLQDVVAVKIVTPGTNSWEVTSTDISLVRALMRMTCGFLSGCSCGDRSVVFLLQKCPVSWVKPILPVQDFHTVKIFAFWWLCVALPPSLPLRCCIHHHDNCVPFGCIAVPFCGFLWRRAGTHWTPLTTAWDVQAQDRMMPGQTPATFCELTVILQDFYQFFNPFTYLPWSYLLRDLCVDLLCGARSWRDDFHSTGTKKDSRQGMHFKAPGKATALLINSMCVSALSWLPDSSLLLPSSALGFGAGCTSWHLTGAAPAVTCPLPAPLVRSPFGRDRVHTHMSYLLVWKGGKGGWGWDEMENLKLLLSPLCLPCK